MPYLNTVSTVLICDASPLIFLAKVDGLELLRQVIPGRHVVLACVVREVLGERAGPVEGERLRRWLAGVDVVDFEGSVFPSQALSRSDQSTLAWAVENRADWLLADERLLRRFAKDREIRVIGFCGILVKAVERGFLHADRGRDMLDAAVDEHGLMISIALYRRMIEELKNSNQPFTCFAITCASNLSSNKVRDLQSLSQAKPIPSPPQRDSKSLLHIENTAKQKAPAWLTRALLRKTGKYRSD